jgi:hypothetical protein
MCVCAEGAEVAADCAAGMAAGAIGQEVVGA